MQSIGYQGYEVHKHLHDDMRSKTLPALEKDLLESNYSQESIHHFIGICLGWLTAHIMIEDRAITGKISNRWKKDNAGKNITALEGALTDFVQKIWGLPAEIVSEHYNGEDFGNSMIVRLIYRSKEKKKIQIFLVLEEILIFHTVSSMLDMPLTKMDNLVANAVRELSQQIADQIILHFRLSLQYQLESSHFMTPEQFQTEFSAEYFSYSLLFNTGTGYFAFCIK